MKQEKNLISNRNKCDQLCLPVDDIEVSAKKQNVTKDIY